MTTTEGTIPIRGGARRELDSFDSAKDMCFSLNELYCMHATTDRCEYGHHSAKLFPSFVLSFQFMSLTRGNWQIIGYEQGKVQLRFHMISTWPMHNIVAAD